VTPKVNTPPGGQVGAVLHGREADWQFPSSDYVSIWRNTHLMIHCRALHPPVVGKFVLSSGLCSKRLQRIVILYGNSTPIMVIPRSFSRFKGSGFPVGCADSATADGRRRSNLYEVDQWLWKFGRCKPGLGGLTVDETAMRKNTVREENVKRSAETRRRRRVDGA
jgi:hypothetical protein